MLLTDEDLSFAIDLEDFIKAIKMELGVTGESGTKINTAVDAVLKGIKGESIRIMG